MTACPHCNGTGEVPTSKRPEIVVDTVEALRAHMAGEREIYAIYNRPGIYGITGVLDTIIPQRIVHAALRLGLLVECELYDRDRGGWRLK